MKTLSKKKESILKKVDGLIARTSSDADAEARTSALLACKLIREHQLKVSYPPEKGDTGGVPSSGVPADNGWWEGFVDDVFERVGRSVKDDHMYIFKANYPGTCVGCGVAFMAGADIVKFRHRPGYYHAKCSNKVSDKG